MAVDTEYEERLVSKSSAAPVGPSSLGTNTAARNFDSTCKQLPEAHHYLNLADIGDIDFRIKVDRFRGLEVANKFRVPVHTCTKALVPPRNWLSEAGGISSPRGVPEVLTVDSSRLEHDTDLYFFLKIINVSSPLRVTVLGGQAVTVRDHHELLENPKRTVRSKVFDDISAEHGFLNPPSAYGPFTQPLT
ncbi:hypothetical protein B0T21DRAFT_405958 [Apiosordaria backusii]|uniref:Uncharacterized protein n=1 Tax=Apiosordaria backusii TaxID=314023 RepID=A0AA40EXF1_9PEZI|nr:hypothetical protein B0T21DRAFT_405958 [Apiosordaria backusii]